MSPFNKQKLIRRIRHIRIRTRHCVHIALIAGFAALVLLAMALHYGDFLSGESYITGFTVTNVADGGEALLLESAGDESLSIFRKNIGSDDYFRIKKKAVPGSYVRASIYRGELLEIEADGEDLLKPREEGGSDKQIFRAQSVLYAAIYAAVISVAFAVFAVVLRKKRAARTRRKRTS